MQSRETDPEEREVWVEISLWEEYIYYGKKITKPFGYLLSGFILFGDNTFYLNKKSTIK